MTEPEDILARWSRRKRAAAMAPPSSNAPAPLLQGTLASKPEDATSRIGESGDTGTRAVEPLPLPPIDSITSDTDIRDFLRPGVPVALSRAALRRAWVADPAIRDFVGLAEYDWDFNKPDAMAGFGAVEMTEDLRASAARIVSASQIEQRDGVDSPSLDANDGAAARDSTVAVAGNARRAPTDNVPADRPNPSAIVRNCAQETTEYRARSAAEHREQTEAEAKIAGCGPELSRSFVRRRHGGALPR